VGFPLTFSCDEDLMNAVKEMSWPSEAKIHFGTTGTSNKFPTPVELYDEIKEMAPLSIDMETSAFYQVGWLLNIPILAVRGISNLINHAGVDENIGSSDLMGSAQAAAGVLISILDKLISKFHPQNKETPLANEINSLNTRFNLKAHPEGGYYARIFESAIEMKAFNPDRFENETRKAGTAIYYLLQGYDFSAFQILKSDEIWHYCQASPIILHIIHGLGNYEFQKLGNPAVDSEASFQVNIPAGNWFAAEVIDKNHFSFVGCTVSPGFEFKDFLLGDRDSRNVLFPQHASVINRFTRVSDSVKTNTHDYIMKFE
jgi:predicted cupin superfamily sugar epimerase